MGATIDSDELVLNRSTMRAFLRNSLYFEIHGCYQISTIEILLYGFFSNILRIRSFNSGEMLECIASFDESKTSYFLMIICFSSSLTLDLNGTSPKIRPYRINPRLQMSMAGDDCAWPWSNSGDMYFREPACTFSGLIPETEPKMPKSTSFNSKSNSF